MPTNNKDNCDRDDESNPFVAFRHFADEGINQALGLLTGSVQVCVKEFSDLRQRFDDAEKRAFNSFQRSYERAMNPERVQTETRGNEDPVNKPTSVESLDPHDAIHDQWFQDKPTRFQLLASPQDDGKWIPHLGFFAFNQYSPLLLERQWNLQRNPLRWREAFEDLLMLQHGECDGQRTNERYRSLNLDANIWLHELSQKSLIRHRLPLMSFFDRPLLSDQPVIEQEPEPDVDAITESELDHYEHFLGNLGTFTAASGTSQQNGAPGSEDEQFSGRMSVISTMTTTEKRVLPDGTISTKRVLKKRFADGREETNEIISTTHAVPNVAEVVVDSTVADTPRATKAPQKSWFWS